MYIAVVTGERAWQFRRLRKSYVTHSRRRRKKRAGGNWWEMGGKFHESKNKTRGGNGRPHIFEWMI